MKLSELLFSFITVAVTLFLFLHFFVIPGHISHNKHHEHVNNLSELARAQNETIHELQAILAKFTGDYAAHHGSSSGISAGNSILTASLNRVMQLQETASVSTAAKCDCPRATISSPSSSSSAEHEWRYNFVKMTKDEKDCDMRYGMGLVESWRNSAEVWCETDEDTAKTAGYNSELVCYPYHQRHKQLDGRGPDMFCVAKNFVIDFSKISGNKGDKKQPLGQQYFDFKEGSLTSVCKKTTHYKERMFMPHNSRQMRTFKDSQSASSSSMPSVIVDTSTFLLARDEDFENSFHSTADFMNMFLVNSVLGSDMSKQQVMLFDRQPDGPYIDLIKKAYSPNHNVARREDYNGERVLFRQLVFHLESPAGLIFPKVSRPDPLRCYDASLFDAYRRFVLSAFDLLDVAPPAIPSVTLSLRHRTPQKNVGRVMANEEEVVSVLRKGNMMHLNVVDTSTMSYYDQLKLIRNTNVLVGVHGAGLMFIMFAAEEAVLVEIHPSYRQDRHFRHASRMTRKIYMPMRATQRESCKGSSDSVTVPIAEFETTMDGALRLARNFDDGLSECGLVCPGNILAIDNRLDPHYKSVGMTKVASLNTNFPC